MNALAVVLIVILILVVAGVIAWVLLKGGLPFFKSSSSPYGAPQPARGGIVGWVNDRLRALKNRNTRTAAGAYESSGAGGPPPGRRGFGPLDPDEAWDARVDNEDQELGLTSHHGDTSYGGSGDGSYPMNLATTLGDASAEFRDEEHARGRTRSRSPGLAPGRTTSKNPFDDDADPSNLSMRAVSPRPIDTAGPAAAPSTGGKAGQKDPDSPTERRSIFREEV